MNESYQVLKTLEDVKAVMAYHQRVFGDFIAEREGYKRHREIDAIHFYLIQKYNWLPSVVRSLSNDDLEFLLAEEMDSWQLPSEAK